MTPKVCLFDPKETSLRDILRSGGSDDVVMQTIGIAVRGKKEKHAGMEDIDVVANRPNKLIGPTSGRTRDVGIQILANQSPSTMIFFAAG
jgi:hypothetical protein